MTLITRYGIIAFLMVCNAMIWGFYFVRVMILYSEVCVAKRYGFGCIFCNREGSNKQQVTQIIVPFSVSVLAVVTNKVEPPT